LGNGHAEYPGTPKWCRTIMDKEAVSWVYLQLGKFRGHLCEEFPIHVQETRVIGAAEGLQAEVR
jgi:hypothetical protein